MRVLALLPVPDNASVLRYTEPAGEGAIVGGLRWPTGRDPMFSAILIRCGDAFMPVPWDKIRRHEDASVLVCTIALRGGESLLVMTAGEPPCAISAETLEPHEVNYSRLVHFKPPEPPEPMDNSTEA